MSKRNPEREALKEEAKNLELEYDPKITTPKLKELVEAKKTEVAAQMQGNESDTETEAPKEGVAEGNNTQTDEQENEETHEDEIMIQRTSPCGNYRAKIKGIKEVARRTPDTTEEEVREALETGDAVGGWKFKVVEE